MLHIHILFNWILTTVLWDVYCYLTLQMRNCCLIKLGNLPKNVQLGEPESDCGQCGHGECGQTS